MKNKLDKIGLLLCCSLCLLTSCISAKEHKLQRILFENISSYHHDIFDVSVAPCYIFTTYEQFEKHLIDGSNKSVYDSRRCYSIRQKIKKYDNYYFLKGNKLLFLPVRYHPSVDIEAKLEIENNNAKIHFIVKRMVANINKLNDKSYSMYYVFFKLDKKIIKSDYYTDNMSHYITEEVVPTSFIMV